MKIIGDKNKATYLRVYRGGEATDTYIEYHTHKNDIDAIRKTGADHVVLYTRHAGNGAMTPSWSHSGRTAFAVQRINLTLAGETPQNAGNTHRAKDAPTSRVEFRCRRSDKARWVKQAQRDGQKLSAWIISRLNS